MSTAGRKRGSYAQDTNAWAALVLLICILCGSLASAGENLLLNGDLTEGAGSTPAHWVMRTVSQAPRDNNGIIQWSHRTNAQGELRVAKTRGGQGGNWAQTISLGPGWYYLSAEARLEDADNWTVATLRIKEGHSSAEVPLHASNWQRLGSYFIIGPWGDTVDIECGLSGPGRGKALFRNFKLTRVRGGPPVGAAQFDLERAYLAARNSFLLRQPTGSPWTVIALLIGMVALAFTSWLALGSCSNEQGSFQPNDNSNACDE